MPTFTYRRRYRAFPRRHSRARAMARGAAVFLGAAIACSLIATRAFAGPGSGEAILFGPDSVTAGHADTWTIQYRATEAFAAGGLVELTIPPGWSAPQNVDTLTPGYLKVIGQPTIDSVEVSGRTIRVYLAPPFHLNSTFRVNYGLGGSSAHAHAQTTAQDSVLFLVRSDPPASGSMAPLASSPSVKVVADPVVVAAGIVDGSGAPVDTLTRTTDQDTTQLFLRGYDTYGNPGRLIACDWTLTGGVGAPVPAQGTGTALRLDAPGAGVARADSAGVWADSTGTITVRHGAYAAIEMSAGAGPVAAGAPLAVTARAYDADGNTVTDGMGSAAGIRFVVFTDSVGGTEADPNVTNADATLAGGTYSGTLIPRRAGTFWLAVSDTAAGLLSTRHRMDVTAGGPDHLTLRPDTLRLVAGDPDTVTVLVFDPFGNRAPVPADETLTLWTDRPSGAFRDLPGSTVLFEVTLPAGRDSARFTFTDTRTTSTEGRIRAIDANGAAPFLGLAGAPVFTSPSVPASIALSAIPDTIVANGADSVLVVGIARDTFANVVAAGERFTLTGSASPSVTPLTDEDPGAAGFQLLADASGAVRGYLRAGTTAGLGAATVTAERGSASGSATFRLLAGIPSGPITLSAPADSLAADSVATLSIGATGLHDAGGNPVQDGETYTVSTSLGSIVTPDADGSTPGIQVAASGGGISFTLFGGDQLGNALVTATAVRDTTSAGTLGVRLVPGAISGARSLVSAGSPAPVGAVGSVVSVTLRDAQDHPISNVAAGSIVVTVSGLTASASALAPATDGSGHLDFRVTTTTADTARVQVTAGGTPLVAQPTVIFTPGPLHHYTISGPPGPLPAGVGVTLDVAGFDSFGNPLPSESGEALTPTVTSGAATVPPSVTLTNGNASISVTPTQAAPLAIHVSDGVRPGITYGPVAVNPAAPSGAIAVAATRDTLTADGHSAATLTFGPVRDAYGNPVGAGALIGVATQAGTLIASDASVLFPGLDLVTGANSLATAVLVAAATAGPDTVTAASRAGSATGTRAFLYLPRPSLDYVAGSLQPLSVTPGASASFTLDVRNTGPGPIQLGTGSTFSFSSFSASLGSPATIGAGATATLTLASAMVPSALPPGSYAPSFRAVGTDQTGASFDFYPSLAGAQVSVLGVGVAAVSASPDPVPLGGTVTLVFDITNASGTPGDFTGATVAYSAGAFLTGAPSPPFGTTIPAGATTRFTFSVQAPSSGIASGTVVDATLQATLTYAGNPVSGASVTPLSFQVVSAAQITAVGAGSPVRLLRGRTFAPSVTVANSGSAAVTLARGATRLLLDRGATTLLTALGSNTAVQPSEPATLAFDSLAVSVGTPKGRYRARLFLSGTESGQAFADTVSFAPDSLDVVDPALLSVVAGSLAPDTVSAGQARPLAVTLHNDGDVPYVLDPSTTLVVGAPVSVSRTLGAASTVGPGASVLLTFVGGSLGSGGSPGDAAGTLGALGSEDGVARAQSLAAGTLHAMPPAALQYVARSTSPAQTRPGQTIDVTLEVRNAGGSPFLLDPGASRLSLTDGTDVMTGLGQGSPLTLAPAGRTTLTFPGLTVPAAMASQPYRVELSLSGAEWGLAETAAVASPDSEIVVLDPLAGLQARAVDTGTPLQVAPGAPPVRVWGLELTPLAATGSGIADSLRSVAITVLTDGSAAPAPYGAVTSIALRDAAGTLLAQTAPASGAPNPVTLTLATPLALGNAPESLFVDVAFRAGTPARGVALRLARPSDVVVVDVFTGGLVPIVGGGGLPFTALTSPEVTFFDRPHGYPNPFHAGSEAILLSYVLGQDAAVKVSIYTLFGELVRTLTLDAGVRGGAAGLNEVPWDGRNGKGELVRPGVYVARLEGPGLSETIKVGVLR